jgi:hypothetical protein
VITISAALMLGGLYSVGLSYAAFDAGPVRARHVRWSLAIAVFGALALAAAIPLYLVTT